jgi:hypothetical protein
MHTCTISITYSHRYLRKVYRSSLSFLGNISIGEGKREMSGRRRDEI